MPDDEVTQHSLRFAKIYALLEQNYVEPLDPDHSIFDGGIRGMIRTLDPFSSFLDAEQFEQFKQQAQGKARGFGSVLYVQPGKVVILQTAEGSPSWRAGLGPGDEIVEVNATRVNRLDFESLVDLLLRARTQRVRLGVIKPGKVVAQDLELVPAELNTPTVKKAFLLKPGIAYMHISGFDRKTPREVEDALKRLGGEELKGLLLDLRDNYGGVLESAIQVASLFLRPGRAVLTARGRSIQEQTHYTRTGSPSFDLPLIVLVNGYTASASEVLAAALQEHDRALIVGEPTFGKGVVESVAALSEGTGLALTTAQYFTPSGRSIQRPIPGTALAAPQKSADPASGQAATFRTTNGRPVSAGGGITPDVTIPARTLDPWAAFIEQRGSFVNFSSEFLTLSGRVDRSFQPGTQVLEKFRQYLTRHRIRVPEEYWGQDQEYLKLRIKAEVLNLVFGLTLGDEVETRGDPQVQKAVELFPEIPELLNPPAANAKSTGARHTGESRRDP